MAVIGYIFTGIGYQYVGIGKEVYDKVYGMRQYYDRVQKRRPDFKINMLAFIGPKEELMKEDNGLTIMCAYQCGINEVLKHYKVNPEQMAGFKSGELTCLAASDAASFEDILGLIDKKKEIVAKEIKREDFINVLVSGVETAKTAQVAAEINKAVKCEICCYAGTETAMVVCEKTGLVKIKEVFAKMNAVCLELPYEEISNFSLMQGAAEKLKTELGQIKLDKPVHRVLSQVTGNYYDNAQEIKEKMCDYIYKPARLDSVIGTMLKNGVNTFVEAGCGSFIAKAVRKIDSGKRMLSTHDLKSLGLVVKLAN
jgi:[acyl-carrier-protein] S-malonyltransferase